MFHFLHSILTPLGLVSGKSYVQNLNLSMQNIRVTKTIAGLKFISRLKILRKRPLPVEFSINSFEITPTDNIISLFENIRKLVEGTKIESTN